MENIRDKKELIKTAMDCMQNEIDRITNDHNEHLKKLFESHNAQISETKKKQWVNRKKNVIMHDLNCFIFAVLQLRTRCHISLLLEYSLLFNDLPAAALASRTQESLSS